MIEPKKYSVEEIAEQIVRVQPIPSDTFSKLYSITMTEQELRDEGYKPVSRIGLMWIKDE